MNSKSLFSKSWAYIWRNNRKELLRSLWGLLRDRPVFLFLTVACIVRPTWWGLLVVPLALVFNQMIIEIFSKRSTLHSQHRILTGFFNIYEQPDVVSRSATKYMVSDYLDWQYEDIDKNFLKRLTGLSGIDTFSIDNTVDLYHLKIVGANCPNLICYNVPPLKSYIFLNSAPHEKKQAFKKFCLLHELGHAALHFTTTSTFAQHGNKLYFTLIVFLAILCSHHLLGPIFYGIIAVLLLLSLVEKFIIRNTKKVNDECTADMFAIGYLDMEERKALREFFLKYPAKDTTLSDTQNKVRHQVLLNNLDLMILNEDNENVVLDHIDSRIFKPSFGLLLITCGLVGFLAFYVTKIGGYFTLGLFIVSIVSFLAFCFLHLMIYVIQKHITNRLEKWAEPDNQR